MKKYLIVVVINLCCFLSCAALLFAAQPPLIRYQGQAVNSQGVPLEGPYTLTFRLYTVDTAGTPVWEEAQTNVPLSQGQFSVLLGQTVSLANMDWSQPLWLAMQINAETELAPRQRIASVPLAIRANVAEALTVPVTTSTISDDAHALVPAGAIILWTSASCPAGYTRLTSVDGKFLVSGAAFNAAAGGSNTHSHTVPNHSHTLSLTTSSSTGPSHGWNAQQGGPGNVAIDAPEWQHRHTVSGSTDVGGGGTTGTADSRPEFATVLLCQRN